LDGGTAEELCSTPSFGDKVSFAVEGMGVCDGNSEPRSCDSTMDPVPLIADSFSESDDSCSALAASRSISSFNCSTLVRSQRAMSNGSNRREEDTSHQHRSARRMTAGSGAATGDERAAVMIVAKVAFVAQELDTDESRGMGCQ
jgi:hypothetical protein